MKVIYLTGEDILGTSPIEQVQHPSTFKEVILTVEDLPLLEAVVTKVATTQDVKVAWEHVQTGHGNQALKVTVSDSVFYLRMFCSYFYLLVM